MKKFFCCGVSIYYVAKNIMWSRRKGRETIISPLTKTGEPRVIPGTQSVLEVLDKLRDSYKRKSGLIFSYDGFKPITNRSIQSQYNRAFENLGLTYTSTHILRHSFATDFLEVTRNPSALQMLLGHKNLKQTEHYAKVTEGLVRSGINHYQVSFDREQSQKTGELVSLPVGEKSIGWLVQAGTNSKSRG